jgi:hypothetical protein
MPSNAKQVVDKVRDDFVEPVAKGAAAGAEKLAKGSKKFAHGSEAVAEGARKMADKTQDWADEVTGAHHRRRKVMWLVLAITVIGAVIVMMARSES